MRHRSNWHLCGSRRLWRVVSTAAEAPHRHRPARVDLYYRPDPASAPPSLTLTKTDRGASVFVMKAARTRGSDDSSRPVSWGLKGRQPASLSINRRRHGRLTGTALIRPLKRHRSPDGPAIQPGWQHSIAATGRSLATNWAVNGKLIVATVPYPYVCDPAATQRFSSVLAVTGWQSFFLSGTSKGRKGVTYGPTFCAGIVVLPVGGNLGPVTTATASTGRPTLTRGPVPFISIPS